MMSTKLITMESQWLASNILMGLKPTNIFKYDILTP